MRTRELDDIGRPKLRLILSDGMTERKGATPWWGEHTKKDNGSNIPSRSESYVYDNIMVIYFV